MGSGSPGPRAILISEDLALSLKTRIGNGTWRWACPMDVPVEMGMEDMCRLDCNEKCKNDRHSPSHLSPLLFIPFSVSYRE